MRRAGPAGTKAGALTAFVAGALVASSPASHDTAVQQRLWTISEELTGVAFPVGAVAASAG
jgi:hypothetical protein